MIRPLCRNLHHLCDPKQRFNPTHLRSLYSSIPKSQQEPANPNASLTVSFLVDSCGLSLSSALSAANKVHLKSHHKPNAVLRLLKDHGFTDTQIAILVAKFPKVLLSDPEKTIKPKFEFFHGVGYSAPNLAKLISLNQIILFRSLNKISYNFSLLSSFLGSNVAAATIFIKSPWLIHCKIERLVLSKVKILQDHGVPLPHIVRLATKYPRTMAINCDVFKTRVDSVKELGHSPTPAMFARAVFVMCAMSRSKWEEKLAVYRSVGWSEKETFSAFMTQPSCMTLSEEKIRRAMDFYVNKLHLEPSFLSSKPTVLLYSLEKRIVPRCAVFTILSSKGLVSNNWNINTVMPQSEKVFFEKYVLKYSDKFPDVLEAYQRRLCTRNSQGST